MAREEANRKKQKKTTRRYTRQKPLWNSLELLDKFIDKRFNFFSLLIIASGILFSLLLFDRHIGLSGDDSAYIMRAHEFIHSFSFPGFQGPLYPIVLSVFVALFGISLVPLKTLSLISMIGFLYLFIRYFHTRISSTLIIATASLASVNAFILYYASQTYSEAFYMFIQILLLGVFFRLFIDNRNQKSHKSLLLDHLILGCCLLALSLTRSIGFSAVLAVVAYFLFSGQWRNVFYSLACFLLLLAVFQGIKLLVWGSMELPFSDQGFGLLYKDYYNPQFGKENFAGLITRFYENANLYFSKHFLSMTGLRNYINAITVMPFLTILISIIFVLTLIVSFKQNKYLFFTALVTASFLVVSFLVLQASWDQSRLIIPVLPFMILLLFGFFHLMEAYKKMSVVQIAMPLLFTIMLVSSFNTSTSISRIMRESQGQFDGFTPDWEHYMRASEWIGENLADNERAACRKPSISFVYGKGHDFYGIFRIPHYDKNIFLNYWEANNNDVTLLDYNFVWSGLLSQYQLDMVLSNVLAIVIADDDVLLAIDHASTDPELVELFQEQSIPQIPSAETFKNSMLNDISLLGIYYPDSLLQQLIDNNVTHILSANLRHNINEPDGATLNTVERFAAFINEKYPSIFTKVVQIGADNNEPASVYRIEYEYYGIERQVPQANINF